MCVGVDQAGHDDLGASIQHIAIARIQAGSDIDDQSITNQDVGLSNLPAGIKQMPAADQQLLDAGVHALT